MGRCLKGSFSSSNNVPIKRLADEFTHVHFMMMISNI